METFSLFELNEYIRRVIALNFEDTIWVKAEISQINQSRSQYFLDLVEKDADSDAVKAQISAVLWGKTFWFIKKKLGTLIHEILRDGIEVRIKVNVDYHERYGLKLIIEDIDPTFTLGSLEIKRRKVLEELRQENLLDVNSSLPIPYAIQRVAVISSSRAAGYQDFLNHLLHNGYGYDFDCRLYDVSVQGSRVEPEVLAALGEINADQGFYDCVVLVRGGGAKLDLAGFDSIKIGRAVARCTLPVFTGIGHDIDQSVADIVAAQSFKTPTAVANFILDLNAGFESELIEVQSQLMHSAKELAGHQKQALFDAEQWLRILPGSLIESKKARVNQAWQFLSNGTRSHLARQNSQVNSLEKILEIVHPQATLKRGFSITRKNGKILRSKSAIQAGDHLETMLPDGTIDSVVQ